MLPLLVILPPILLMGFKSIKYFVDSTFRATVMPVPGSVVYCDLWLLVEHSGIYVENERISNIVVDGFAESTVQLSDGRDFTTKSKLGRKIYVSCNRDGAVGHPAVAQRATNHLGERSFYGLVFKNCHQFSAKCVNQLEDQAKQPSPFLNDELSASSDETWEPTMAALKVAARNKLGATKWQLWNWQKDDSEDEESKREPDWDALNEQYKRQPLTPEAIVHFREQLAQLQAYEEETADENLPPRIRQRLHAYGQTLTDISDQYEKAKDFLAACPRAEFSYADLQAIPENFAVLARQMGHNPQIRELVRKMGRQHISEKLKRCSRVSQASKSEVHGTHRSDDVMRLLPSELLNLEDDTLETLFYARLLEKSLQTYELSGSTLVQGETAETRQKRTGPVVACLDTSGSMSGEPLLKAKALLLAIAGILQQENRSLHVILFGSSGQLHTYAMDGHNDAAGLLAFLQKGFGGGTDFETPLRYAMQTVAEHPDYIKADVLMISDGDCSLSDAFTAQLHSQKERLNCLIYSVLCAGTRVQDNFSDEVVVL